MKSKKIVVLFFLLILSSTIYSQKCKTKTDPFSEEKIISFDFRGKTVYFEIKKDKILLEIVFNYPGERTHKFKEETIFLVKLENGDKIKLISNRVSLPVIEEVTYSNGFYPSRGGGMTISSSANFTAYSFAFSLTKSELNKLAKSKIQIIRVPETDEKKYIDIEAKGRTKKKIKAIYKGANCIVEKI